MQPVSGACKCAWQCTFNARVERAGGGGQNALRFEPSDVEGAPDYIRCDDDGKTCVEGLEFYTCTPKTVTFSDDWTGFKYHANGCTYNYKEHRSGQTNTSSLGAA